MLKRQSLTTILKIAFIETHDNTKLQRQDRQTPSLALSLSLSLSLSRLYSTHTHSLSQFILLSLSFKFLLCVLSPFLSMSNPSLNAYLFSQSLSILIVLFFVCSYFSSFLSLFCVSPPQNRMSGCVETIEGVINVSSVLRLIIGLHLTSLSSGRRQRLREKANVDRIEAIADKKRNV